MTTPDPRAAAARLTFLTALVDLAKAELAKQRAAAADVMEPGEAHPVRTPAGEMLARVRMSNPQPVKTARITDHVALTEWIGREYPERIVVTPTVSDRTADVLAVLSEHAPHLVQLSTSVPEWATTEIVAASRKAGEPVGPGGELDVPGIVVETTVGEPSVSVAEKAADFLLLVQGLAASGRLTLDGTLRELPAADAPAVVDAESEAA